MKNVLFEAEILRLMVLVMAVKPIGLVTQVLIAYFFGAGPAYDAYAYTFLLVTFVDSALGNVYTAVVVPFTIKFRETSRRLELHRFQNAVYLLYLLPVLAVGILLLLRGNLLIDSVGAGLPLITREYAHGMIRMMAIPGVLLLAVAMLKATLNLHRRFRVPAAQPVINGVIVLLTILLGHEALGIWCLPVGFGAGILVQTVILFGFAGKTDCLSLVKPRISSETVAQLFQLSWMVLVSQSFLAVNRFIDRWFAGGLESGSISSIAYATTIMTFGIQLFVFSLVTVMFTRMSEYIAAADYSGCSDYIQDNLWRMSRIVVPASLALALSSAEIVRLLFERGAFTQADSVRTTGVLGMYLVGLPALLLNAVVARIYHSLQKLRDRMWLALQFLLTNAAGNALLVGSLQVKGLAIASSIAINVHLFLSLWVLHRYRTGLAATAFSRTILLAYGIGLLTLAVYQVAGIEDLFAELTLATGFWRDPLVLGLRCGAVFGIFACLYLGWRFLDRRLRAV